ncbi:MAG: Cobalt/nickel ABC transporter, permease [Candidatus Roizmanbacteria bacterium GW2011_GWA2_36_23]|uniref:Cobalt/nickel ABC transporter, permease n=1 Tax=Candidatus Roizmanbacteria bacterium GW2011_GWA2_36_23 TaxID=1618480 RepID=A0A0G0E8A8_9BACT|nr:MAG: Cobalt/nickel ABC transporter, permease [Candidatus Roizmanbacteria bacterium GW2011_GWA2_36_23]
MKRSYLIFQIFILFGLSAYVLYNRNVFTAAVMSLLLAALSLINKNHIVYYRRLKYIFGVSIFVVLFQVVFNRTVPMDIRLANGLLTSFKLFSISFLVLWFTSNISFSQLVESLNFLKPDLRLLIIMSLSLIPLIFKELEMIQTIQKSRAVKFNFFSVHKIIPALLVPLLHRIFQQAQNLSLAIISRGYE